MWDNSLYTDIQIKFPDTTVQCHKLVLGAVSPYFNAMFNSGLKENSSTEVEIQDIDAGVALSLMKYIYTGIIDITTSNVESLVRACVLLQVTTRSSETAM